MYIFSEKSKLIIKSKKAVKVLKALSNGEKQVIFPFNYYIGKIYLDRRKKENSADKFLKKALKIDPTYYQAVLGRGLIKEEEEAIKVYETF